MTMSPVREGEVLAGKYRVERVLGMGGMGVVVAATHLDLLELRALKFMLPTALDNAEAVERFHKLTTGKAPFRGQRIPSERDASEANRRGRCPRRRNLRIALDLKPIA